MNFLRLSDYLLSILFEDEEILAIDKPYGINSHTNDLKIGNSDFIQDGLIEIFEKQLETKLYIIHRLDQTTSGVIVFGKSPAAAKKYADFFFQRQVKKTYWFVTGGKSQKDQFFVENAIVHKGKELEAKTRLSRLKQSSGFELWQANPLTGRNHQIRIHAKAVEIPILGDEKYGGAGYPFLCLHNHLIEFPNGLVIKSISPKYFEDLDLLKNQILAKSLFEVDRRNRLFSRTAMLSDQCLRLVHNKNDFKDLGFTIDQFGKILVLSCYDEKWTEIDHQNFSQLVSFVNKPMIVRLMHNRGKDPLHKSQFFLFPKEISETDTVLMEPMWLARENGIKYEIRSDSGLSFGLFLDQRLQRNWVLRNSKNKIVLNLFSYTGGFSVAAALGLASQVTSVDTSKAVLNWSKRNFQINEIDPERHKFLCRDSVDFLTQTVKKDFKYDLIICDPPSFSRGERGVFKIDENLEVLLQNCLKSLSDNGDLLFSTNFEGFYIDDIRKKILNVQRQLGLRDLEINSIQSGLDFELPGKKSILKSFLIRKRTPNMTASMSEAKDIAVDFDED